MKNMLSYFSHTNKSVQTTENTPKQMETGTQNKSLSSKCEATSSSASSTTNPTSSACTVADFSEHNSSFDANWPSYRTLEQKD
jgi:hypothetical protein